MEKQENKQQFYTIIQKLIDFDRVSHAYLIEINDYNEDENDILNFVKLILCPKNKKSVNYLNCGECDICKNVDHNTYLDLKIIEAEGTFIKKSQLLELQLEYRNKSLLNNKRIYIIKDANKLNSSSANTILKFLEEPEDNIIALLLSNNRYQVLDTILSRCQILSLKGNSNSVIFSDESIQLLDYMVHKEQLFIEYKKIFDELMNDKNIAKDRLCEVESIIVQYLEKSSSFDQKVENSEVSHILKGISIDVLTNYISIIEEELKKLDYNVNYKLWLDGFFSKVIGG